MLKQCEIAEQYHVSESLICRIKNGERWTDNMNLAIDIAKTTKEKPISYISPRLKDLMLKAYPNLNRRR
jgi:hypothetical protein